MSVTAEGGLVRICGAGRIEDAEALAALLEAAESPCTVDLSQAGHLHAAVVQVLLAFGPRLAGPAGDAFVNTWLLPVLAYNAGQKPLPAAPDSALPAPAKPPVATPPEPS